MEIVDYDYNIQYFQDPLYMGHKKGDFNFFSNII